MRSAMAAPREPCLHVAIIGAFGIRALDLLRKPGRHASVGIDRAHPTALREREREILLPPYAAPLVRSNPRALFRGDRRRAIGAAGVDHDALVAKGQAVEAGADI